MNHEAFDVEFACVVEYLQARRSGTIGEADDIPDVVLKWAEKSGIMLPDALKRYEKAGELVSKQHPKVPRDSDQWYKLQVGIFQGMMDYQPHQPKAQPPRAKPSLPPQDAQPDSRDDAATKKAEKPKDKSNDGRVKVSVSVDGKKSESAYVGNRLDLSELFARVTTTETDRIREEREGSKPMNETVFKVIDLLSQTEGFVEARQIQEALGFERVAPIMAVLTRLVTEGVLRYEKGRGYGIPIGAELEDLIVRAGAVAEGLSDRLSRLEGTDESSGLAVRIATYIRDHSPDARDLQNEFHLSSADAAWILHKVADLGDDQEAIEKAIRRAVMESIDEAVGTEYKGKDIDDLKDEWLKKGIGTLVLSRRRQPSKWDYTVSNPKGGSSSSSSETKNAEVLASALLARTSPDYAGDRYFVIIGQQGKADTQKVARAYLANLAGKVIKESIEEAEAVPGVAKWSMHAGGTSAAADKHGYTHNTAHGTYHIDPVSHSNGRHKGYSLKFTNNGPKQSSKLPHHGLWHDVGMHGSPGAAAKAARAHHNSIAESIAESEEIAYRIPGKGGWKRKTFKSEADANKFIAKLRDDEGDDVEVRWSDDKPSEPKESVDEMHSSRSTTIRAEGAEWRLVSDDDENVVDITRDDGDTEVVYTASMSGSGLRLKDENDKRVSSSTLPRTVYSAAYDMLDDETDESTGLLPETVEAYEQVIAEGGISTQALPVVFGSEISEVGSLWIEDAHGMAWVNRNDRWVPDQSSVDEAKKTKGYWRTTKHGRKVYIENGRMTKGHPAVLRHANRKDEALTTTAQDAAWKVRKASIEKPHAHVGKGAWCQHCGMTKSDPRHQHPKESATRYDSLADFDAAARADRDANPPSPRTGAAARAYVGEFGTVDESMSDALKHGYTADPDRKVGKQRCGTCYYGEGVGGTKLTCSMFHVEVATQGTCDAWTAEGGQHNPKWKPKNESAPSVNDAWSELDDTSLTALQGIARKAGVERMSNKEDQISVIMADRFGDDWAEELDDADESVNESLQLTALVLGTLLVDLPKAIGAASMAVLRNIHAHLKAHKQNAAEQEWKSLPADDRAAVMKAADAKKTDEVEISYAPGTSPAMIAQAQRARQLAIQRKRLQAQLRNAKRRKQESVEDGIGSHQYEIPLAIGIRVRSTSEVTNGPGGDATGTIVGRKGDMWLVKNDVGDVDEWPDYDLVPETQPPGFVDDRLPPGWLDDLSAENANESLDESVYRSRSRFTIDELRDGYEKWKSPTYAISFDEWLTGHFEPVDESFILTTPFEQAAEVDFQAVMRALARPATLDERKLDHEVQATEVMRITTRSNAPQVSSVYDPTSYQTFTVFDDGTVVREAWIEGRQTRSVVAVVEAEGIEEFVRALRALVTEYAGPLSGRVADVTSTIGESVVEGYQHVIWKGSKSLRYQIAKSAGKKSTVQGRTFGGKIGIHMDNNAPGGEWIVSHIPTGFRIGWTRRDEDAVAVAKSLEGELGDKLDFTDPSEAMHDVRLAISAAQKRLASNPKPAQESADQPLLEFDPITAIGLLGTIVVGGAIGAGVVKAVRQIQSLMKTGKKSAAEKAWDHLSKGDQASIRKLIAKHEFVDPGLDLVLQDGKVVAVRPHADEVTTSATTGGFQAGGFGKRTGKATFSPPLDDEDEDEEEAARTDDSVIESYDLTSLPPSFLKALGMNPDGTLVPRERKTFECPECHEANAYWKEIHADTGMDEMVLRCPDCGAETSKDERIAEAARSYQESLHEASAPRDAAEAKAILAAKTRKEPTFVVREGDDFRVVIGGAALKGSTKDVVFAALHGGTTFRDRGAQKYAQDFFGESVGDEREDDDQFGKGGAGGGPPLNPTPLKKKDRPTNKGQDGSIRDVQGSAKVEDVTFTHDALPRFLEWARTYNLPENTALVVREGLYTIRLSEAQAQIWRDVLSGALTIEPIPV